MFIKVLLIRNENQRGSRTVADDNIGILLLYFLRAKTIILYLTNLLITYYRSLRFEFGNFGISAKHGVTSIAVAENSLRDNRIIIVRLRQYNILFDLILTQNR